MYDFPDGFAASDISALDYLRVWIFYTGQIRCAGPGIKFVEDFVIEGAGFEAAHLTFGIIDIAKSYSFGWTGLFAGSFDLAVADRLSRFFGIDPGAIDALDAVGALFHNTAVAYGNIGVIL